LYAVEVLVELAELLLELLLVDADVLLLVPEVNDDDDDDEELEPEFDVPDVDNELVLSDSERVSVEVMLPVELELDELEESTGGPAEYTTDPAGCAISVSPADL
jgi:hypothetical protein